MHRWIRPGQHHPTKTMIVAELSKTNGAASPRSGNAPRVLLIGQRGFIGASMARLRHPGIELTTASHSDAVRTAGSKHFDVILNCAFDPQFRTTSYQADFDADLKAARMAASLGAHFVMLSSRRVYASRSELRTIDETEAPAPDTQYGRNKLESENRTRDLLNDRCTVLRISNVFGYEPGRSTFFGQALGSLRRERRVILDVSPFVIRDFIPIAAFCDILLQVLVTRPVGIFNLGAGVGVPIGQIALWLIRGLGAGELVVTQPEERDAFVLDSTKIKRTIPRYPAIDNIEAIVTEIGEAARNA